ncbi:MAG: uroporphyrinogen-III synthase [Bacillus sp. (in: firmicutes)]
MEGHTFLRGKKVLITRPERDSRSFADSIARYGGKPVAIPLIGFQACDLTAADRQLLRTINEFDWLVFTSKNGVEYFFQQYKEKKLPHIAVIGTKTMEALEKHGYKPSFVPSQFVAETFVEEFIPFIEEKASVLVVKGNLARSLIKERLEVSGRRCQEIILYENQLPIESEARLQQALQTKQIDVVTFSSSSTVHHFMQVVKAHHLQKHIEHLTYACIGPVAKKTAEQYGLSVDICAEPFTMDGLLQGLIAFQH